MNLSYKVPGLTDAQKEREHQKLSAECKRLFNGQLSKTFEKDLRNAAKRGNTNTEDKVYTLQWNNERSRAFEILTDWIETESENSLLTASSQIRFKSVLVVSAMWYQSCESYHRYVRKHIEWLKDIQG
jgi:hypothetical protein